MAALWREHDLQPHRQGTFGLSTDPDFEEKVIDAVGLYLDPPMDAVVLSKPFTWTSAANEIITKVRLIRQDFKKLLANNDNS